MEEKYYLVLKNDGNGIYRFDTIVVSDGQNIKYGSNKGDIDPDYSIRMNKYNSDDKIDKVVIPLGHSFFEKLNNKSFDNFLVYTFLKKEYNTLYIQVDKNFCDSVKKEFTKDAKNLDEVKQKFASYLFWLGDSIDYIKKEGEFVRVFKKNSKIKLRNLEFVCEAFGLPYTPKKMNLQMLANHKITNLFQKIEIIGKLAFQKKI